MSFRFVASHSRRLTMFCPCAWGDLRPVLRAMAEGKLTVAPWIAAVVQAGEAGQIYRRIHERDPLLMAALIRWM